MVKVTPAVSARTFSMPRKGDLTEWTLQKEKSDDEKGQKPGGGE